MTASCPICKKPVVFEFRPFCSKRCADLDLARWFRGEYRIEGEEEVDEDKKDPQAEDLE